MYRALRRMAEQALDLFRSQFERGEPSWPDAMKAITAAAAVGLPAFLVQVLAWAAFGLGHMDPEPLTKLLLYCVGYALAHFAYLVASKPQLPTS